MKRLVLWAAAATLAGCVHADPQRPEPAKPETVKPEPTWSVRCDSPTAETAPLASLVISACADRVKAVLPTLDAGEIAKAATGLYPQVFKQDVTSYAAGVTTALPPSNDFVETFKAIGAAVVKNCNAGDQPSCAAKKTLAELAEFAHARGKEAEARDAAKAQAAAAAAKPLAPGVERITGWWDANPSFPPYWHLSQLTGRYAVFGYTHGNGKDYLVALERDSIPAGVGLNEGTWLPKITDCVRKMRVETWADDRGFPRQLWVYRAVPCG